MNINLSCINNACRNSSNGSIPVNTSIGLFGPTFFIFIFGSTLGIIPNIVIIVGIVRKKSLHMPTYYLIANLAICDLLLSVANLLNLAVNIIAIRIRLSIYTHNILCKFFTSFPTYWSYTASIQTLIFISGERYQAVFRPTKTLAKKRSLRFCVLAWIIALLLSFPVIITTTTNHIRQRFCVPFSSYTTWTGIYNMTLFIFQYALPALVMTTVYSLIFSRLKKKNMTSQNESHRSKRLKRRTIYMLFITTLIFLVLSAPWALTLAAVVFTGLLPYQMAANFRNPALQNLVNIRRTLLPFASLYNPIIYCIFQKKIRKLFIPCQCTYGSKKLGAVVEPTSQSRTDCKGNNVSELIALSTEERSHLYKIQPRITSTPEPGPINNYLDGLDTA